VVSRAGNTFKSWRAGLGQRIDANKDAAVFCGVMALGAVSLAFDDPHTATAQSSPPATAASQEIAGTVAVASHHAAIYLELTSARVCAGGEL
jgi:hypothetical protein